MNEHFTGDLFAEAAKRDSHEKSQSEIEADEKADFDSLVKECPPTDEEIKKQMYKNEPMSPKTRRFLKHCEKQKKKREQGELGL